MEEQQAIFPCQGCVVGDEPIKKKKKRIHFEMPVLDKLVVKLIKKLIGEEPKWNSEVPYAQYNRKWDRWYARNLLIGSPLALVYYAAIIFGIFKLIRFLISRLW